MIPTLSEGTQSIIPITSGHYLGHHHISALLRSEMYYLALFSLEFCVGILFRKGFSWVDLGLRQICHVMVHVIWTRDQS
jgi:hypothetical protein